MDMKQDLERNIKEHIRIREPGDGGNYRLCEPNVSLNVGLMDCKWHHCFVAETRFCEYRHWLKQLNKLAGDFL